MNTDRIRLPQFSPITLVIIIIIIIIIITLMVMNLYSRKVKFTTINLDPNFFSLLDEGSRYDIILFPNVGNFTQ